MKTIKVTAIGLVLASIAMPYFALAQNYGINSNVFNPGILAGPLVICTGVPSTVSNSQGTWSLPACSNLCQFVAQIADIIYYIIALVLWIIAPVLFVMGGLEIMLYGASPEMVSRGKGTITGAIWGVVIVLCAWVIVATFVKVIGISGVGGFGASACII